MLGMDPATARTVAARMNWTADEVYRQMCDMSSVVRGVAWRGADADSFRSAWRMTAVPVLTRAVTELRTRSTLLLREADEQEATSRGAVAKVAMDLGQYGLAYKEYFGENSRGERRRTIHTDAVAPGHGIIVARFFIPGEIAVPKVLAGDDRGYSTDPRASFRVALAWNTDTGEVTYTVTPSRRLEPDFDLGGVKRRGYGPIPPVFPSVEGPSISWKPGGYVPAVPITDGGPNSVTVKSSADEGGAAVEARYSGLNSVIPPQWLPDAVSKPAAAINGDIGLRVDHAGNVTVTLRGDDYPSFEAIQYLPGGASRSLGRDESGGAHNIPAFVPGGNRRRRWVNGED